MLTNKELTKLGMLASNTEYKMKIECPMRECSKEIKECRQDLIRV